MRNYSKIASFLGLMMLTVFVASSEATPIQGAFSIFGNYLPVAGSPALVTTLDLATGVDFINLFGSTPTPGVPGAFLVSSANGDFSSLVGHAGLIQDLTFAPPGAFSSTPISGFESVFGMTFDLLSVTAAIQTSDVLFLNGSGVFHLAGLDATPGTFKLTANGADGTFSFSASDATTVPEPSTLLLIAGGVVVAGYGRRRRVKQLQQI
jgi:hypothetical protein